jgi:hypothetical protein
MRGRRLGWVIFRPQAASELDPFISQQRTSGDRPRHVRLVPTETFVISQTATENTSTPYEPSGGSSLA